MIKEFALVHPKVAAYIYSIDEANDAACVTLEPLKGTRDYPQCARVSIAEARRHYQILKESIDGYYYACSC